MPIYAASIFGIIDSVAVKGGTGRPAEIRANSFNPGMVRRRLGMVDEVGWLVVGSSKATRQSAARGEEALVKGVARGLSTGGDRDGRA
jgi:hypothetical protein